VAPFDQRHGIQKNLHGCFPKTVFAAVDAIFVVVLELSIQIVLQLVKGIVDLSVKSYPIGLIKNRLVKSFTDTIALQTSGLGITVVNVLYSEV